MTTFQLLLTMVSGIVFYLFFKQLFSGSYPKRGADFDAKVADEQIGGISRPDKLFVKPKEQSDRIIQLHESADEAVEQGDYAEAIKALESALILDPHHAETQYKLAYIYLQTKAYVKAKAALEQLLAEDAAHDMAHAMLANVLHLLGEDGEAMMQHEKAIALDPEYAPHYFNYANTLYDRGENEAALIQYEKAHALDPSLEDAKKMIEKLSE